jgi:aconitase A
VPLVVFAEYGTGSSRDWAAKGTKPLKPRQTLHAEIVNADGARRAVPLTCRIDTLDELEYFRNGGILSYVLRQLAA